MQQTHLREKPYGSPVAASSLVDGPLLPPAGANTAVDVSFIIPVYNESENVDALIEEVSTVGNTLGRRFEIIIIDDGSKDDTLAQLAQWVQQRPDILLTVVSLRRNYGQTAATAAGFYQARGRYIVTLDGDLQNDPADVPQLLDMMDAEGLDIISGWRKNRQDKALTRKLPSAIANWMIGRVTGVPIHDNGCSLKVYRAEVAKEVPLYGEMHRFITALASMDGAVIKEVPVNHRPRLRGQSKYNLSRTFKVVLDLLTVLFMKRFFTRPLHMFGRVGISFLAIGILAESWLMVEKLVFGLSIGTRPLLLLGALCILAGIQLISTGLIAEIQVRTYFESQQKPIYKIRHLLRNASLATTA
jgi:glycosyltransferase involved in cell wall biosynthesis